jgi:hypothetical protein
MRELVCVRSSAMPEVRASPLKHPPHHVQFFKNIGKAKAKAKTSVKRETIIPEPSYNVPLGLLAISGAAAYEHITPLAAFAGLLGVFLTIQASRVK